MAFGGWDFNPGVDYLHTPPIELSYRHKTPGRFNPYLFSPKVPTGFNGKVIDLQLSPGNYPLYTLLRALQYQAQMLLGLLLRLEQAHSAPSSHSRSRYWPLENFLAYLYLKLRQTLAPLRSRQIWKEVDRGARFLIGESIQLYWAGRRASWRRQWWKLRQIAAELCRRQLLLLRILGGNPKCGCREFIRNSYATLYYYCYSR